MTRAGMPLLAFSLIAFARAERIAPALVPAAESVAPTAGTDFSEAFEKLFELGLPDTRGAVFVRTSLARHHFESAPKYAPTIQGFAWRFPSKDGKAPKVIVHGIAIFEESIAPATAASPYYIFSNPAQFPPGTAFPIETPLKESDLKKTVESEYARLLDWKKGREEQSGGGAQTTDRWTARQNAARLAPFIILAAQAHRAGHTAEANRLAELTMACAPTRESVLKYAVSPLADIRWCAALHSWRQGENQSPERLAKELESISHRFASAWNKAPAARHLLKILRTPAAEAEPELPGWKFTPDRMRLAREILSLRTPPPPVDWLCTAKTPSKTTPLIESLRTMGIEALPVLAALAEDTTPTGCVPDWIDHHDYFNDTNDEGEVSDSSDEIAYDQWRMRPMTRGEIILHLLAMPYGHGFAGGDSSSVKESVLADYETLKTKGKISWLLAKAESDKTGRHSPFWRAAFAEVVTESDAKQVEDALISRTDKPSLIPLLPHYLRKRGPAAVDFLQRFTAASITEMEELDDSAFENTSSNNAIGKKRRRNGGALPQNRATEIAALREQLEKLTPLVAAPSATKQAADSLNMLLDEIPPEIPPSSPFGEGPGLAPLHEQLREYLAENESAWDKVIPALLTRAAGSGDFDAQIMLLNTAQQLLLSTRSAGPASREQLAQNLPLFRTIRDAASGSPINKACLQINMESLVLGHGQGRDSDAYTVIRNLDTDELVSLLDSRFETWAKGDDVPDWPSASKVTTERHRAMLSHLAESATEADYRARHDRLTLDEKIAWSIHLFENWKKLPPIIEKARSHLTRISAYEDSDRQYADALAVRELIGNQVDGKFLRELLGRARTRSPKTSKMIVINPSATGSELRIRDEAFGGMSAPEMMQIQVSAFRRVLRNKGNPEDENAQAKFPLDQATLDTPATEKFWKFIESPTPESDSVLMSQINIMIPGGKPAATNAQK